MILDGVLNYFDYKWWINDLLIFTSGVYEYGCIKSGHDLFMRLYH